MDCASTLSLYSHHKPSTTTVFTTGHSMLLHRRLFFTTTLHCVPSPRRGLHLRTFVVRNDSSGRSGRSRRVYTESQSETAPLTAVPVKEIASFVLPVGSFIVVTFGIAFYLLLVSVTLHFIFIVALLLNIVYTPYFLRYSVYGS